MHRLVTMNLLVPLEFGPLSPFDIDNAEYSGDDVALPLTVTHQPGSVEQRKIKGVLRAVRLDIK